MVGLGGSVPKPVKMYPPQVRAHMLVCSACTLTIWIERNMFSSLSPCMQRNPWSISSHSQLVSTAFCTCPCLCSKLQHRKLVLQVKITEEQVKMLLHLPLRGLHGVTTAGQTPMEA